MQKISFVQKNYAESFLLCRKFPIMQKVFLYGEKISDYAKKKKKKKKKNFYAGKKKVFKHEPFTKTMSVVD